MKLGMYAVLTWYCLSLKEQLHLASTGFSEFVVFRGHLMLDQRLAMPVHTFVTSRVDYCTDSRLAAGMLSICHGINVHN